MKAKCVIPVVVVTLIINVFSQQFVKAGDPTPSPSNTAGAATVRGVVKFEGKAPKPTPINMAADPTCAKQHPTPVLSQDVVTDPKGGLQNVIVFVADGLGDRTFVEEMLSAYDTEKRLQAQGLAPKFSIEDCVIEAGPSYFDSAVKQVGEGIDFVTAELAKRDVAPYTSTGK